jgi:hypothetical protein
MAIRIKQRKDDGGVGDFILLGTGGGRRVSQSRQASGLEGSNEAEPQIGVYGCIDANEILRGRNMLHHSVLSDPSLSVMTAINPCSEAANLGAAQHNAVSRLPLSTIAESIPSVNIWVEPLDKRPDQRRDRCLFTYLFGYRLC